MARVELDSPEEWRLMDKHQTTEMPNRNGSKGTAAGPAWSFTGVSATYIPNELAVMIQPINSRRGGHVWFVTDPKDRNGCGVPRTLYQAASFRTAIEHMQFTGVVVAEQVDDYWDDHMGGELEEPPSLCPQCHPDEGHVHQLHELGNRSTGILGKTSPKGESPC